MQWRFYKVVFEIMRRFLSILFLFCCAGQVHARDYYVSNDGNDKGLGTQLMPWATLDRVEKTARAGDRVFLHKGSSWVTQFNVPASDMTIDAYGEGAAPVIDGSLQYFSIAITGKSHITIRNLTLVNAANDCVRVEQKGEVVHDLLIENTEIRGCGNDGMDIASSDEELFAGKLPYGIQILNNNISKCGNAAVQVRAQAAMGINRIAKNSIDTVGTKYPTNAISLMYVHGMVVEHNVIRNTHSTDIDGSGITTDYLSGTDPKLYGSGTVVRYNQVECPSPPINEEQAGIAIWYQPDVQIYGNTVRNCNDGVRVSGEQSTGYSIHDNKFINIHKRGAAFTSKAASGELRNNNFSGTGDGGVGISVNGGSQSPAEHHNNIYNFREPLKDMNDQEAGLSPTDTDIDEGAQ